ncbi:hypothetical protein VTK73DRAFT_9749 [Phialemonium thermophilum]|uniref:Uncharacterized protein n=1 Tax=Phialemonium thermophilum TaxID=223376 RepID=A0ABR3W0J5_9PEZI
MRAGSGPSLGLRSPGRSRRAQNGLRLRVVEDPPFPGRRGLPISIATLFDRIWGQAVSQSATVLRHLSPPERRRSVTPVMLHSLLTVAILAATAAAKCKPVSISSGTPSSAVSTVPSSSTPAAVSTVPTGGSSTGIPGGSSSVAPSGSPTATTGGSSAVEPTDPPVSPAGTTPTTTTTTTTSQTTGSTTSTSSTTTTTSSTTTANPSCHADNCLRAVSATRLGASGLASHLADCSSFLEVTVTPSTSTVLVTETVSVTVTTEILLGVTTSSTPLAKRLMTITAPDQSTPTPKTVPTYASACSGSVRYASACSCFGATAPTLTAPTPVTTSTVSVVTTFTQVDYDSPPLASQSVSFPEFDDWTLTYTYEEYALPVFGTPGPDTVIVSYPTPSPTCLLDATPTGDAFFLLAPSAGLMVERDGALGPIVAPTTEEEGDTFLDNFNPPTFEFRAADDAADGLFDLVLLNATTDNIYVAVDANTGAVTLLPQSTSGRVNPDGFITTAFGVSCLGSLVVQWNDIDYVWTATDSATVIAPGQPATDNTSPLNTMILLPASLQQPIGESATTQVLATRDQSQDGPGARCPGFPYGTMSAVSNGFQPSPPNGCGPDGAWYTALVPNLNFGGCCNTHDTCYDTCSKTFVGCNNDFLGCMRSACSNTYNHWYNSWLRPACNAAASLYYAAVSGSTAQGHFVDDSKQECSCVCSDPSTATCGGDHCFRVRGAGANNNDNCGACGWSCGPHGHCQDGQCFCNPEPPTPNQCGKLCLDFLTHPRNCGGCGNVCASGYCYQGACFDPPAHPDHCYPVDAVQNGGFESGSAYWSVSQASSSPLGSRTVLLGAPDVLGGRSTLVALIEGTRLGVLGSTVTLSQTVHLCPGTQYVLDVDAFWAGSTCNYQAAVAGRVFASGALADPRNANSVGTWFSLGPVSLPVLNEGDAGTSMAANFYMTAQLDFTLSCGGLLGVYMLDNFSIHI